MRNHVEVIPLSPTQAYRGNLRRVMDDVGVADAETLKVIDAFLSGFPSDGREPCSLRHHSTQLVVSVQSCKVRSFRKHILFEISLLEKLMIIINNRSLKLILRFWGFGGLGVVGDFAISETAEVDSILML